MQVSSQGLPGLGLGVGVAEWEGLRAGPSDWCLRLSQVISWGWLVSELGMGKGPREILTGWEIRILRWDTRKLRLIGGFLEQYQFHELWGGRSGSGSRMAGSHLRDDIWITPYKLHFLQSQKLSSWGSWILAPIFGLVWVYPLQEWINGWKLSLSFSPLTQFCSYCHSFSLLWPLGLSLSLTTST